MLMRIGPSMIVLELLELNSFNILEVNLLQIILISQIDIIRRNNGRDTSAGQPFTMIQRISQFYGFDII